MTKPVIQILINNEDYLFSQHLNRTLKKLVDAQTKDFNFERLSAKEINGEKLVAIMNTPPMMSDFRVVVVDEIDAFKKQDLEDLAQYFDNPNPQTHVLFLAEKLDKRTTFYKKISKIAQFFDFKPLYPNQIPEFIRQEANELGLQLEPGCAEILANHLGTNLMSLVSELEKLKLYVLPQPQVTKEQVLELVSTGPVDNIFMISNFIGQKKYSDANHIYQQMKEQGEPVIRILALVINHFRKLLLTKTEISNHKNQDSKMLAALLGVHPFFVKDYLSQANRFQLETLRSIYKKLMELSINLRSSGASGPTLFESFLQEICVSVTI